ncbi:hypothetical protein Tco_0489555 [Tanacetum coccineum]
MDKQASEEQPIDKQAKINQPDKVQAERSVPKPQVEKPAATLISPKSKKPEAQAGTNVILKRLTKLETKVEAMSKFNLPEAIDKSVQAHLKKNLPKDVHDFGKLKQEKVTKQSMPKYSTKPFDKAFLKEYDQKDKLIKLIMKSKSYNTHPAHMKLYDSLMDSLLVEENDMAKHFR